MILYIYCAGGFGKEVMDVARRKNAVSNTWSEIKFVDDVIPDRMKYGADVVKFDDLIKLNKIENSEFVIANGEPAARRKIFEKLHFQGVKFGTLIDNSTLVSETAVVEKGVVVTPLCSISSDATLSINSCVNTMSIIGHNVYIGINTVVSSMVNMGGGCLVGQNTYIGMGALIKDGVKIGSNTIIGMGSVVYNDVPDGVIALGNPARVMRNNTEEKVFK